MTQATPISFYATPPHACSYLEDRMAVTVFADPRVGMDAHIYSTLVNHGYRRSGSHIYAPYCPGCDSCRSLRLDVDAFRPDRSQRRNALLNQDLEVRVLPAGFEEEHFQLYRRYIATRHNGGGMDDPDPGKYRDFLIADWCHTIFVEFRDRGRLVGVAVVDRVENGLSAVYTYYDPTETRRGLGTYAVLWQVEEARRLGLPYVFLGYWIAESPKMRYKTRFQPCEIFLGGSWQPGPGTNGEPEPKIGDGL